MIETKKKLKVKHEKIEIWPDGNPKTGPCGWQFTGDTAYLGHIGSQAMQKWLLNYGQWENAGTKISVCQISMLRPNLKENGPKKPSPPEPTYAVNQ